VAEPASIQHRREWFATTLWSVVLQAGAVEGSQRDVALERLCQNYWPPVYAFIRGRGYNPQDAQDLTQDFLVELIGRNDFAGLDRRRGKFRSFLLACLHHFLAKDRRDHNTLKRGGGTVIIPWEAGLGETHLADPPASSPEHLFDRRWAVTVMDQALGSLKAEMVAAGKGALFAELKAFLTTEPGAGDYDALAARLEVSTAAVATAVHRLRRRFRENVRETLAQTVATPLELEEEMRYLRDVLAH
jgi:DNA-directed RNA polymerase specialized sigma24 family protein